MLQRSHFTDERNEAWEKPMLPVMAQIRSLSLIGKHKVSTAWLHGVLSRQYSSAD